MNIHSIDSARAFMHGAEGKQDLANSLGTVISNSKQGYLVKLDSGSTLLANKAFSCAFKPELDDYVMVIQSPTRGYFINSILERSSDKPAQLELSDELHINSQKAVKILSKDIELTSQTQTSYTQDHKLNSDNLSVLSKQASFQSESVESNVTRLVQRIKDSFKIIERIEQVCAKDIIQNIKQSFIQRSKQVDITAKSDVKINGDRIHMG